MGMGTVLGEEGLVSRGWCVRGRVQGVGFRWWVRREGSELELDGWVRNRVDGSVEVVARGPVARLQRLEESLWKGPPAAQVAVVEPMLVGDVLAGAGFGIVRRSEGGLPRGLGDRNERAV
jgi:acylphosphatase